MTVNEAIKLLAHGTADEIKGARTASTGMGWTPVM